MRFLGLLISGGFYTSSSVELFDSKTKKTCVLPDHIKGRFFHTLSKNTACGGVFPTICETFNVENGAWKESETILQPRYHHTSWDVKEGMFLMGGWSQGSQSVMTTELVNVDDGTVQESFQMKYNTL